jgi:hypothetical protein
MRIVRIKKKNVLSTYQKILALGFIDLWTQPVLRELSRKEREREKKKAHSRHSHS